MKIFINEKQEKILHKYFLKEAMSESFSFEELKVIKSFKGRRGHHIRSRRKIPARPRSSDRRCIRLPDSRRTERSPGDMHTRIP